MTTLTPLFDKSVYALVSNLSFHIWLEIYILIIVLYSHKLTLPALPISDGGYHRLESAVDSLRLCIESQVSDIVRNDDGIGDTAAEMLQS